MGRPKIFEAGGVWTELEFGEDGEPRFSGELTLYLPDAVPANAKDGGEVPTWQRAKTAQWLYRAVALARVLRGGEHFIELNSDRFDVCTRIVFLVGHGYFVMNTAKEAPWLDGWELEDILSSEPWEEPFWNDLVQAASKALEPLPLPEELRARLSAKAKELQSVGVAWNDELFGAIEAGGGVIESAGGELSPLVQRMVWATETDPHRAGGEANEVWSGNAFPGCKYPPAHLLTLDLSAPDLAELELPAELRAWGTLPIVFPSCGGCDAWMLRDGEMIFDVQDGGLKVAEGWAVPPRCKASGPSIEREATLATVAAERPALPSPDPSGSGRELLRAALKLSHAKRAQEVFLLGGSPICLQSRSPRPTAEGDWWFLGQRNRGAFIYVFVDPKRRKLALTMQVS